jgi:hypothetical protein
MLLFSNVTLNFEITVICRADLVRKVWATRDLRKALQNYIYNKIEKWAYLVNMAECPSEGIQTESRTDPAELPVDLQQFNGDCEGWFFR